jgi:dUTP pyrophosphatase
MHLWNPTKKVAVKILDKEFFELFQLPNYATPESAGIDLRACLPHDHGFLVEKVIVKPGQRYLCPTGLAFDLNDKNLAMFLIPKSGLGHKKGIILGNSIGLLDSDYHLECFVSVWNTGNEDFIIEHGMFIAQAFFAPVARVEFDVVDTFDRTVHRKGGFGSTGNGL